MRTRMNKPALLLSLLALGALALVACGGGDDDQTTVASADTRTPVAPTPAKYATEVVPKGTGHKAIRSGSATRYTPSGTGARKAETKTTRDKLVADNKYCGRFGRYKFAVVEGDVSCRMARGVMRANSLDPPPPGGKDRGVEGQPRRFPGSWSCDGPDAYWVCLNEAEEIGVAWCCGTNQREAMRYIPAGLRE
jgi:hypothetical protein